MMRKHLPCLLLSTLLMAMPGVVYAQNEGGLAERRAIVAYQKDTWPAFEKAIQDAAGFPVPVELDLKSLALPGYADSYAHDDYVRKPIITPLIQALEGITADAMGRDALREKLKAIRIRFDEATAPASNYASGVSFDDGVLVINWKPFSNVDEIEPRVEALTKLLESKL